MGTHSLLFFYFNDTLRVILEKSFDGFVPITGQVVLDIITELEDFKTNDERIQFLKQDVGTREYLRVVEDQYLHTTRDFEHETWFGYHIYMDNDGKVFIKVNRRGFEVDIDECMDECNRVYGVFYTHRQFEYLVKLLNSDE